MNREVLAFSRDASGHVDKLALVCGHIKPLWGPAIDLAAETAARERVTLTTDCEQCDEFDGMPGEQPQTFEEFSQSCDRLDGRLG